ncbi:MAG TPA: hypothetical protein VM345_12220 [Acidimicrobiales bacterium]|jgi:hypothetical protein|nr:hypothetical protein [Acidimicrobiales bacterium]
MAVTGADERIHPVEDPSAHWSDSLYFNLWDPSSRLFLLTRMAILPNKPGATAGVLAWIDGTPFAGYGHNLDDVPLADWDDMGIGALRYHELSPLESWEITLDDGDDRMYLRWDGFTGVVDYADNAQPLPKAVAWGHYEQTCAVAGSITLQGRSIEVRGVGQRDHSWGYRDWAGLQEWHWITGFVRDAGGADSAPWRSFNLFHVIQPDGSVTVNGFVHDAGTDHLIVAVERTTDETDTRSPERYELALTVEGGRTFTFFGDAEGLEVPVRPHEGGTIVHERLTRITTDDGLVGMGIYELLENTTNPPTPSQPS